MACLNVGQFPIGVPHYYTAKNGNFAVSLIFPSGAEKTAQLHSASEL
jgi:hypothetical protein